MSYIFSNAPLNAPDSLYNSNRKEGRPESLIRIKKILLCAQEKNYNQQRTKYKIENMTLKQIKFSPWIEAQATDMCYRASRLHIDTPYDPPKDFISQRFGSVLGNLVVAPAYRKKRQNNGAWVDDVNYTLGLCKGQSSLVVMNNVYPAQPILNGTVGLLFRNTTNLKILIHQSALFARICLKNNVIHGDFYTRNVHCVCTTEGPVQLTFIDFERAEMNQDDKRLGEYWFSAICSYFLEFVYKACHGGFICNRGEEKCAVIKLINALNNILTSFIDSPYLLFDLDTEFKKIFINEAVWEKWIMNKDDCAIVSHHGLQGLFERQSGSNFRIKQSVIEDAGLDKDKVLQMIYQLLML